MAPTHLPPDSPPAPRRDLGVAITGLGLVTCLGANAPLTWAALLAGETGLAPSPAGRFADVAFARCGLASGPATDDNRARARALLAIACDEALGAHGTARGAERWGLSLGTSLAAQASSAPFWTQYLADPATADYALLASYDAELWLDALAERFDVRGPACAVSSACAAGASAIAQAAQWLITGAADRVLACGADPVDRYTLAGFHALGALAKGPLEPLSAARDGMALSDGFSCLVLERERDARAAGRPILARLAGAGESSDAFHRTQPDPTGAGAALAMRRALASANLAPDAIDFVSLHATATVANDAAEVAAMRTVFEDHLDRLALHAAKPALGHSLGAAGGVEAALCVLALVHQVRPPTVRSRGTDPAFGPLVVDDHATPAAIRHAMSNAFGFGGCNASLVLSRSDA